MIPLPADSVNPWIGRARVAGQIYRGVRDAYPVARSAYQTVNRAYKRAKRSYSGAYGSVGRRSKPNYTSNVKVARGGGIKRAKLARKSRRRRKLSTTGKLKKRIKRLEKGQVSLSHYRFQNCRPFSVSSAGCNLSDASFTLDAGRKVIFRLASVYNNAGKVESVLSNVKTDENTGFNFADGSRNPKVRMTRKSSWKLKNSGLSAVTIKYVNYVCTKRTSKAPLTELNEYAGDHGFGGWTHSNGRAKDATGSLVFPFLYGTTETSNTEFLSHIDDTNSYKQVGTVSKVTLRPGDEVTLYAKGNMIYRAEDQDRDGHSFMPQLNFGVLVQVTGEVMHDDTLVTQVGYSNFHIDGINRDNLSVSIDNGLGHYYMDNDSPEFEVSANGWTTAGPSVSIEGDGN